jgi:hypothetical protein
MRPECRLSILIIALTFCAQAGCHPSDPRNVPRNTTTTVPTVRPQSHYRIAL